MIEAGVRWHVPPPSSPLSSRNPRQSDSLEGKSSAPKTKNDYQEPLNPLQMCSIAIYQTTQQNHLIKTHFPARLLIALSQDTPCEGSFSTFPFLYCWTANKPGSSNCSSNTAINRNCLKCPQCIWGTNAPNKSAVIAVQKSNFRSSQAWIWTNNRPGGTANLGHLHDKRDVCAAGGAVVAPPLLRRAQFSSEDTMVGAKTVLPRRERHGFTCTD